MGLEANSRDQPGADPLFGIITSCSNQIPGSMRLRERCICVLVLNIQTRTLWYLVLLHILPGPWNKIGQSFPRFRSLHQSGKCRGVLWFLPTCSHLASGLLVTLSRGVREEKVPDQKSPTWEVLPYCTVRDGTEWRLGPCSLVANQKAYVLPGCNSMSVWINKTDFYFSEISSELLSASIQPGRSMKVVTLFRFVFQWHW